MAKKEPIEFIERIYPAKLTLSHDNMCESN